MKKLNLDKIRNSKVTIVDNAQWQNLTISNEKEALTNEILTKSKESLEKILKQK